MRYVNSAIATLADAIELDKATTAYVKRANDDLHTLPKAELLSQERESMMELAVERLNRAAFPIGADTFKQAIKEISRRKEERARSQALRIERQEKQRRQSEAFA